MCAACRSFVCLHEKACTADDGRDEHDGCARERSECEFWNAEGRSSGLGRSGGWSAAGGAGCAVTCGSGILGAGGANIARSLSSAILEVLLGVLWDRWETVAGDLPVGGLWWARACGGGSLVATVAGWSWGLLVCVLEGGEIGALADGVARDVDETVVGFLLGVFVDEATGVDGGHVAAVEGGDLTELAGVCVATKLGQASAGVSRETCRIDRAMLTRLGFRSWRIA
jgi:hypothetical protein